MDYTATVDIETTHDVDEVLEMLTPYSGAVAESKIGYRAAFSFPATNLDDAYRSAMDITAPLGTTRAIEIAPTALLDADLDTIPHLVSISEAADMLSISVQAVHKRIKTGSLPARKVGNSWVIPLYSVLDSM